MAGVIDQQLGDTQAFAKVTPNSRSDTVLATAAAIKLGAYERMLSGCLDGMKIYIKIFMLIVVERDFRLLHAGIKG